MNGTRISDEEVEKIVFWPEEDGYTQLMMYVHQLWHCREGSVMVDFNIVDEYAEYDLDTNNNPYNESIIEALKENKPFMLKCWSPFNDSGKRVFRIPTA